MTYNSQHTPEERFLAKIEVDQKTGCWMWTASCKDSGYGQFWIKEEQRCVPAHCWAYEFWIGPIPDGLDLDHTCHNSDTSCPGGRVCPHRKCVNPDHLEPETRRDNLLKGRGPAAMNAVKVRCLRGHSLSGPNLRIDSNGDRQCRTCDRYRARKSYRRRKTQMKEPK